MLKSQTPSMVTSNSLLYQMSQTLRAILQIEKSPLFGVIQAVSQKIFAALNAMLSSLDILTFLVSVLSVFSVLFIAISTFKSTTYNIWVLSSFLTFVIDIQSMFVFLCFFTITDIFITQTIVCLIYALVSHLFARTIKQPKEITLQEAETAAGPSQNTQVC